MGGHPRNPESIGRIPFRPDAAYLDLSAPASVRWSRREAAEASERATAHDRTSEWNRRENTWTQVRSG
jgi:hypothetical protein